MPGSLSDLDQQKIPRPSSTTGGRFILVLRHHGWGVCSRLVRAVFLSLAAVTTCPATMIRLSGSVKLNCSLPPGLHPAVISGLCRRAGVCRRRALWRLGCALRASAASALLRPAVGVRGIEQQTFRWQLICFRAVFLQTVAQGAGHGAQVKGHNHQPLAVRILQRERLGIQPGFLAIGGTITKSIACHPVTGLRCDEHRGGSRLPSGIVFRQQRLSEERDAAKHPKAHFSQSFHFRVMGGLLNRRGTMLAED